jgi:hypothetical protein
MKFPLQKGWSTRASGVRPGVCCVCKKGAGEPYNFAWLNGIGNSMDPKATVSLSIGFHGRHDEGHDGPGGNVEIVQEAGGAQFEFYYCSTRCLRRFFGKCVDELETRIKEDRKRKRLRPNKSLERTRER